jgi:hypothetical protein
MSDNDGERRKRTLISSARLPAPVESRIRWLKQQAEIKRLLAQLPPQPNLPNERFAMPGLKAPALPEEHRLARIQELYAPFYGPPDDELWWLAQHVLENPELHDLVLPADASSPQAPAQTEEQPSEKLEHKRGRNPKLSEKEIINGQTFFETMLDDDGSDWENNPSAWAKNQIAAALYVKEQLPLDCDWQTVFVWIVEPVLVEWKRPVLVQLSQRLKNKPRYLKNKRAFEK